MKHFSRKDKEKTKTPLSLDEQFVLRQKKGRRVLRVVISVIITLCILGLLIGAWWVVFRSGIFEVRSILVDGNRKISSEEVIQFVKSKRVQPFLFSQIFGEKNMLAWPKGEIPKDEGELTVVSRLSVKKDYGDHAVIISVEERDPLGVWCKLKAGIVPEMDSVSVSSTASSTILSPAPTITTPSDGSSTSSTFQNLFSNTETDCYWFDSRGVVYDKALAVEGSLIPDLDDYSGRDIAFGKTVVPEEFVQNLFSIFNVLYESRVGVREVALKNLELQEVEVSTYDGPTIYFSLRFPASSTIAVLSSLMKTPEFKTYQYVDFRVENRAYYR